MHLNEPNGSSATVSRETHKYAPTQSFSLATMGEGKKKIRTQIGKGSTAVFCLCQKKTGFLKLQMISVKTVSPGLQLAAPGAQPTEKSPSLHPSGSLGIARSLSARISAHGAEQPGGSSSHAA